MTQDLTVTNSENNPVKREDIYEEFVLWSAMPPSERFKLGIETQEQFTDFHQIGINTPTAWKKRFGFENRVNEIRKEWAFTKTSAVIESIYRSAIKGSSQSQKIWLQYFNTSQTTRNIEQKQNFVIHPDDIRFLIETMPEPYRAKHYAFLQNLLDDAQKLRYSGELENKPMPERIS